MNNIRIFSCFFFFVAAVSADSKFSFEITRNKDQPCGSFYCTPYATCKTISNEKKCLCNKIEGQTYVGRGDFKCRNPDHYYSHLILDPILKTFNNEKGSLPIPCRFLYSHIQTEMQDPPGKQKGYCEFVLNAWNEKHEGKFFVGGYDLAMKISTNRDPKNTNTATIRIEGVGNSIAVTVAEEEFIVDKPYATNRITALNVQGVWIHIVVITDFVVILVPECGYSSGFRPFDNKAKRRNVRVVSGLWLEVDNLYKPEFKNKDRSVALPPLKKGGVSIKDILHGLTNSQALTRRALLSHTGQTQPKGNEIREICLKASQEISKCPDVFTLDIAMENCFWMLETSRFVDCADKTKDGRIILGLFNECMNYFCTQYYFSDKHHNQGQTGSIVFHNNCDELRDSIKSNNKNCHQLTRIPKLDDFMNPGRPIC